MSRRLAFLIVCALPASALADSGRLHLELDVGLGATIAGQARRAANHSDDSSFGGVAWITADYQLSRPWAIEVIFGYGGFSKPFPTSTDTGTRYGTLGIGARLRLLDDMDGFNNEPDGNLKSNLWVSLHLGYHNFDDVQFGLDGAIGSEISVARPVQLGVFFRTALMFGGDNDGVDMIALGGLSVSFEILGVKQADDSDGDGLTDEREATLGTDPESEDTDGDGLPDGLEVETQTDPTNQDTDHDGLNDAREDANLNGVLDDGETDPRRSDTDGGGMPDPDEVHAMDQDPRYAADDDRDGDGVPNHLDSCEGTAEGTEVDGAGCGAALPMTSGTLVLEGVTFASNSADILPESEEVLTRALETVRQLGETRIEIAGHTDSRGNAAANRRLSLRRARAVRDWMVAHGIPSSRFDVRGVGEADPMTTNDTPEGRARNRRIEFRRLN